MYTIQLDLPGVNFDLGEGTDSFVFEKYAFEGITGSSTLDLASGAWRIGDGMATVRNTERAKTTGLSRSVLTGSSAANRLVVDACNTEIRGRAGDDTGRVGSGQKLCSTPTSALLEGGQGDDTLTGGAGPDRIYGNDGYDTANGRAGRDLCRAEVKQGCER